MYFTLFFFGFGFCILSYLSLVVLQGLFSPTCFSYASQYVSRYEAQGEGTTCRQLNFITHNLFDLSYFPQWEAK